ncbi:MAG: tyrosine-type recombinase/integrase [Gammaproteobacteria bacterium]|nr:tyrosine-type recombinase/integrase [Gammaproteobacteria bacterium]
MAQEKKNPQTGKRTGMGNDRLQAIQAARQLNQILMKEANLIERVLKTEDTFEMFVTDYRDHILPNKRIKGFELSPSFLKEAIRKCNVIIKDLGHIHFSSITQRDIAEYLKQRSSAEVFNSHRTLLIQIFKQAISDGRHIGNLPERVMKADTEHTKRNRLSLDEYKAIYKHATPVIRNAMELSLNTIQRRTDIRNWRFDYDRGDGYAYIIQSKTRKHGKAAYLRIPMNLSLVHSERGAKTLSELISSFRDKRVCPYVIHQMPDRRAKVIAGEKGHVMQLTGDQLSKGFAKARKLAEVGLESKHPPTLHELLSLGEFLRKEQGWTVKQIQTLRGHTSEKMTMKYLEGQEWTTVVEVAG